MKRNPIQFLGVDEKFTDFEKAAVARRDLKSAIDLWSAKYEIADKPGEWIFDVKAMAFCRRIQG